MRIATTKPDTKPRKIGFEAPEQIHGALKSIIGWAEMNNVRISDKPLSERDFLQGLIAGFWASGQDTWESLIFKNGDDVKDLTKSVKKKTN
jgi:hypothetical protein